MADVTEQSLFYEQEDTQKDKYLTFILGNEVYGIDIKYVTEIIGIQEISEIPELPEYIRGIINLRGKIIPVIDVRLRFEKPFREYNGRTCIIVVDIKEITVGLIIDAVAEVISIKEKDIDPPINLHMGLNNRYINGIGKVGSSIKLLLDCNELLNHEVA